MGLSWQQGPLSGRGVGHFLTAEPPPERLLYAEPLRRRMRVRYGGAWIAGSEDVVLLHEPGRYPVAFFPRASAKGQTFCWSPGRPSSRTASTAASTSTRSDGARRARA